VEGGCEFSDTSRQPVRLHRLVIGEIESWSQKGVVSKFNCENGFDFHYI
jgi:hypothetical protein